MMAVSHTVSALRAVSLIMLDHRLNPDDISRCRPPRIDDLPYARDAALLDEVREDIARMIAGQ